MTGNALYYNINVTRYKKEVKTIAEKSRADYMKKRREGKKTFSALIDREKAEGLEKKLRDEKRSKTSWLEEKIDEEISG